MVDEMLQLTAQVRHPQLLRLLRLHRGSSTTSRDRRGRRWRRSSGSSSTAWTAGGRTWTSGSSSTSRRPTTSGTRSMIPYLKSIDPYHKPITTSWERPELEGIDINAPHWYGSEDELSLRPGDGRPGRAAQEVKASRSSSASRATAAASQELIAAGDRRGVGPGLGPADAGAALDGAVQRDRPSSSGRPPTPRTGTT